METLQTSPEVTRWRLWQPYVWASIAAILVTILFWPTAHSIIQIWSVSETFAHGYFVIPIFLWLVWRLRKSLASLPANPDLRILGLVGISGALWLAAGLAGIQVAQHGAFALIVVFTLWVVLGRRVACALRFPLVFLLYLAPVGEELVPVLMEITADMTVWAIRNTGIPIFREGLYFSLSSGNWSVVEACSGIRYLIASSLLGSLYAYLSYTSLRLQLIFFSVSLIVPIFANSVRAYMIVMLGHFSDNTIATGVDHLIYGWLFFGIVMFALFSIGSWLQRYDSPAKDVQPDSAVNEEYESTPTQRSTSSCGTRKFALTMIALVAIAAVWPLWSTAINSQTITRTSADRIEQLLPQSHRSAPESVVVSSSPLWQPRNSGEDFTLNAQYTFGDSAQVRAIAYLYEEQQQGKEMINASNVLVTSEDEHWRILQTNTRDITLDNDANVNVNVSELGTSNQRLVVWQWYRIGDTLTSSSSIAKLVEVKNRLLLKRELSVNYILVTDRNQENHADALSSAMNVIQSQWR